MPREARDSCVLVSAASLAATSQYSENRTNSTIDIRIPSGNPACSRLSTKSCQLWIDVPAPWRRRAQSAPTKAPATVHDKSVRRREFRFSSGMAMPLFVPQMGMRVKDDERSVISCNLRPVISIYSRCSRCSDIYVNQNDHSPSSKLKEV